MTGLLKVTTMASQVVSNTIESHKEYLPVAVTYLLFLSGCLSLVLFQIGLILHGDQMFLNP